MIILCIQKIYNVLKIYPSFLIFVTCATCILFKNWLFALLLYCGKYFIPNYSVFIKILMFYALVSYVYQEYIITMHYENDGEFVAWNKLKANQGDIIEFRRHLYGFYAYAHWGIYDDEEIIHLVNLGEQRGVIANKSLESVANGDLCRVNNLEKLANMKNLTKKDEDEIMEIASKWINEKMTYDQMYYNCEHFATECVYGTPFSFQTEIKHTTWGEQFLIKYIKLFFIYMPIVYLWRWQYIRDITNRTVFGIFSESLLNSFVYSFVSFLNLLKDNHNYVYIIAIMIFLASEIIRYFIKE